MERCTGRDPSPLELSKRSSRRQIGPAHHFIDQEEEIFATTEELLSSTLSLNHSSQPPKAKNKIEISFFTKLSSNFLKSEGTKIGNFH